MRNLSIDRRVRAYVSRPRKLPFSVHFLPPPEIFLFLPLSSHAPFALSNGARAPLSPSFGPATTLPGRVTAYKVAIARSSVFIHRGPVNGASVSV